MKEISSSQSKKRYIFDITSGEGVYHDNFLAFCKKIYDASPYVSSSGPIYSFGDRRYVASVLVREDKLDVDADQINDWLRDNQPEAKPCYTFYENFMEGDELTKWKTEITERFPYIDLNTHYYTTDPTTFNEHFLFKLELTPEDAIFYKIKYRS